MTTDNKALAERLQEAAGNLREGDRLGDLLEEAAAALTASPQVDDATALNKSRLQSSAQRLRMSLIGTFDVDEFNAAVAQMRAALTTQPQGDASGQVSGGGEDVLALAAKVGMRYHRNEVIDAGCVIYAFTEREIQKFAAALPPTQARPECEHRWLFGLDDTARQYCARCNESREGKPAPTADGGAVAWEIRSDSGRLVAFVRTERERDEFLYRGTASDPLPEWTARPLIYGDAHPTPKAEVARLVEALSKGGTSVEIYGPGNHGGQKAWLVALRNNDTDLATEYQGDTLLEAFTAAQKDQPHDD